MRKQFEDKDPKVIKKVNLQLERDMVMVCQN